MLALMACVAGGAAASANGQQGAPAATAGGQAATMTQAQQAGPAIALGLPGAQAAPATGPAQLRAGEQIATKGGPNGVTACVACHGAQGEGNAGSGFPRIAGQSAAYLGKQLGAYANGARVNDVMKPIAMGLSAEQIRDVAAYYASLGGGVSGAAAPAPAAKGRGGASARGLQLATLGDESRRVQACANCHGPGGAGEPPINPYLAGQHAQYLITAMGEWKNGERKTDASNQMVDIAHALSDADVAAVAAYFAAQPAPEPASKQVNVATGTAAHPAVPAAAGAPGPHVGGAAAAGVTGSGSEQGAPLTGGSQGSGGGGGTQGTIPPKPPVRK